jgi:KaiC/GvpD/RAD55 family RecA-like ATPase
MPNLVVDGPKEFMKQMKVCKMSLKEPQNEARLSLKPTLRNKRNRSWKKHMKGGHLHKKNSLASLGNVINKKVSTLDMPWEAA